ncbi:S9 family peptidase [Bacillus luteolus]|uniref:S9 family peptidase n=1 Tax=Litchfieldia luteola TaxID=682179 RepID=A0ABR9QL93_9BACI|nr:alpha/beta fold hydrolase [Cytobacillus luteolus]MBE4909196.1 S9 family peptidase [Cytobacillus luteolus]MBP1940351.1 dipeptidyl aminopeptidase/acylaminoacyl peptidase [Cytobacillus luteolus]
MATKSVRQYRIEELLNSESVVYNSISYDGSRVLYSSDKSGVFNAYSVPTTGGMPIALTDSTDDAVHAISYFPHDNRFLYLQDKGGNEILHIFVREENGASKELTVDEKERAEFYCWAQDGKSFFYGSNKRDPRFNDVYEMDIETYQSTLLFENTEGYNFGAISPNKNYLAFAKVSNANNSDLYVFNRETNEMSHLCEHEGDCHYYAEAFNSTSTHLYFRTDESSEFLELKRIELATNDVELVASESWDITNAFFSKNGRYLLYKINNDSKTEVKVIEVQNGEALSINGLPEGQITEVSVSSDESMISLSINSSTSPKNIYLYEVATANVTKLTDTLHPDVLEEDLVKAEIVRFKSFDNLEIPAIMYLPHQAATEKVPALVWVHGGPGGQSTVDYNPMLQYLVNHGYAVLAVNNRGSSGYGKTFFKAADLKHGEVDLADCVEGKNFLQSIDSIDPDKIGIIGGSYGGYMVLAALAFRQEEFKVGVDIFGVTNWERTLKSIPTWWESMRDALYQKLGNPYEQVEYIRSISPLFHADKINKPVIVLQGANDPRVLQVESDEMVDELRKNNVPTEYIVFPDEGHGFSKKENRITGYRAILEFLDEYLK